MTEKRNFIMRWPELDVSVECEPLKHNRMIYDWWMDHFPIRAVQSHAMVTGPDMYALSIWLPEPAISVDPSELVAKSMLDTPIGQGSLGYNERGGFGGGLIGTCDVPYGQLTEDMPIVNCFQVVDDDIDTLIETGNRVWNAVYKTKEIITVEMSLKRDN